MSRWMPASIAARVTSRSATASSQSVRFSRIVPLKSNVWSSTIPTWSVKTSRGTSSMEKPS